MSPHGTMRIWLEERGRLADELGAALQAGFRAVGAFNAPAYLDCIEQQEDLCRQIADLDKRMPAPAGERADLEWAAAELQRMNAELKRLADIQAALIEHGGRSVRCFQRVWALGAPGYDPPK